MSANSAVTVLRSPSGVGEACSGSTRTVVATNFADAALPLAIPASPASAAAHWPPKSNPRGFSNEQSGQVRPSAVRHFPQNFMPAGFSNSHFAQRIGSLPGVGRPMREYRRNTEQRKQLLESGSDGAVSHSQGLTVHRLPVVDFF